MKKVFLIFALIAYSLGMTCDECDAECRNNYRGPALENVNLNALINIAYNYK